MWNISSPARAEKRQGQCPAAAEIYRFLDRLPCFPADYVSFYRSSSNRISTSSCQPRRERNPLGLRPYSRNPAASYSRTAAAFSATTSSSSCEKPACFAHSMHASVSALPMPLPQYAFFNGNAEIRAVAELFLIAERFDSGASDDLPVHKRTDFDGVRAFLARLQELCLVCLGKQIFLRIGQQIAVSACVRWKQRSISAASRSPAPRKRHFCSVF